MPNNSFSQRRLPELDFLRAYAVIAVVSSHSSTVVSLGIRGYEGVLLFFVISGFLITGILLDARARGASPWTALGAFYARRFLRILPIYYAVLLLAFAAGFQDTRDAFGWHLAFLSNWYFAYHGFKAYTSHLWSLAVEEQFYLLWPWIMLWTPSKALPWTIGITIMVGPLSRLFIDSGAIVGAGVDRQALWIATPTVLDALGLGGLLAYLWRETTCADQFARWALAAGGTLIVLERTQFRLFELPTQVATVIHTLGWRLLFVWLVHRAARGIGGQLGRVIRWQPFIYVGTISYGIYLVHPFLNAPIDRLQNRFSLGWLAWDHPGRFVLTTVLSIAIAGVSWRFFESPINSFKERFPYLTGQERPTAGEEDPCRQPRPFM